MIHGKETKSTERKMAGAGLTPITFQRKQKVEKHQSQQGACAHTHTHTHMHTYTLIVGRTHYRVNHRLIK